MMKTRINDWSLNLEDAYYAEHPEKMLAEAVQAVMETAAGCLVNLVTPEAAGDPREGFIMRLEAALKANGAGCRQIVYKSQCGCGGHVTAVFR